MGSDTVYNGRLPTYSNNPGHPIPAPSRKVVPVLDLRGGVAIQQLSPATAAYLVDDLDSLSHLALFVQTFGQTQQCFGVTEQRMVQLIASEMIGVFDSFGHVLTTVLTYQVKQLVALVVQYIPGFLLVRTEREP